MIDNQTNCRFCDKIFTKKTARQALCSDPCRKADQRKTGRMESLTYRYGINKGAVGAISEARVCADLLTKGFHVYKAVSPHSPCDIVAYREGGPTLRIEVKTAYARNGGVYHPKPKEGLSDVVAAVTADRIIYKPSLEGEN